MKHELKYRAGTSGLGAANIPDSEPVWFCSCTTWKMRCYPINYRSTGNNRDEAEKGHSIHSAAWDLVDRDIVATYNEGVVRVLELLG